MCKQGNMKMFMDLKYSLSWHPTFIIIFASFTSTNNYIGPKIGPWGTTLVHNEHEQVLVVITIKNNNFHSGQLSSVDSDQCLNGWPAEDIGSIGQYDMDVVQKVDVTEK